MNLKRLEISGFKSFRDKVILDFASGVTAIVGPNGCGKSNVVDALRWAMGEQRVKALRGKKMDDVVFNGSQDAAPVSMAEVTMTLSANGQSFIGAYAEMAEVSITRRVVRDGDSEYYINRAPCRLLDIKEFFMGTGVGARTYSLVEQGSVASMVEAKPEDRRLFIEDAAGVSKYKSRKDAAVRKMEATKVNVQRLNDIIREVKSQLNAISRQAKRAEQYKEIKQRLRETDITLTLHNYAELQEKGSSLQAVREEMQNRDAGMRANLEARESLLEELKAKLLENDEMINRGQQEQYEVKNSINIKEKNIEFSRRQISDASERKQKDAADIDTVQARKADLLREIENLRENAARADGRIAALKAEHDEGRQKIEELLAADKELNSQLEEKKILYIDVVTEKAKLKNMISSLTKSIDDLKKREERENREIEEDKRRLTELTGKLQTIKEALSRDEEEFLNLQDRKESTADEVEKTKTDLQTIEERIAEIKEETSVKTSRLNSLQEFQEAYKWSNDGIKEIIEQQDSRDKFYGVVADHINVPREYEAAVEAVLGDKLQYVVVKSQEDGVKAIDYLKSGQLGRGSFMPVELRSHAAESYSADHLTEAEPLLRKVNCHEDFQQIADCLLGDVLITPTIASGINLWKKNGFRGTFVTPEGDTISPHGVLTGGSGSAVEKSLLSTKREIAELEKDLAMLIPDLASQSDQRKRLVSLIAQWEEELSQIKNRIHKLEIEVNSRKKDCERFSDEEVRLKQTIAALEFNHQNIKAEQAEAEEKLHTISREALGKEEEEKTLTDVISLFNAQRVQSRAAIDEQERQITGKKVLLASLEEKREADLRTMLRLQNDIGSIENEVQIKTEEIVACEKQLALLAQTIESEQAALEELYRNLAVNEAALAEKQAGKNREDEQLKTQENEIREVKKKLDDLRNSINEIEIKCREVVLHGDNLKAAAAEKHNVALEDLLGDFNRIEEERLAELKSILETDKQKIDNFGEVNLLALNEFEELDSRYQFLSAQISDLNESLASLERTITRINKISRSRFAETFAAVNACFKEVFAHVFPGGHGELLLTDENDLLETGVDIAIQIPGKRAQNVTLLSGGEKSLAAIALIFAILMYRPTPFLVLDEVDAALDDANTNLFNRLIKDVAGKSQVVMITHNKSTMEVADSLFGVTMQKQGISSLVSVNLN
ncbi:MAG: chromosome segregation protein SMC [Deltaproteobacteria bacterium HGW-Deltaproteobacteria-10]|nr:MAG: chromosome segregation protein SMC [Deltaproteobacteria bacterium HGW-Deltaproteobacteria-10]